MQDFTFYLDAGVLNFGSVTNKSPVPIDPTQRRRLYLFTFLLFFLFLSNFTFTTSRNNSNSLVTTVAYCHLPRSNVTRRRRELDSLTYLFVTRARIGNKLEIQDIAILSMLTSDEDFGRNR